MSFETMQSMLARPTINMRRLSARSRLPVMAVQASVDRQRKTLESRFCLARPALAKPPASSSLPDKRVLNCLSWIVLLCRRVTWQQECLSPSNRLSQSKQPDVLC